MPLLPWQRGEATQLWLGDVAVRLLCVMALDRFADFVSDQVSLQLSSLPPSPPHPLPPPRPCQVVAPVRATCAQAVGVVARLLTADCVTPLVSLLLVLASQEQWEVRHAALMATQHLLAARTVSSTCTLSALMATQRLLAARTVSSTCTLSARMPAACTVSHLSPNDATLRHRYTQAH